MSVCTNCLRLLAAIDAAQVTLHAATANGGQPFVAHLHQAAAEIARLEATNAKLVEAARPFVALPSRGRYGGPLVQVVAIYEDETQDRAGKFAQASPETLRALARAVEEAEGV